VSATPTNSKEQIDAFDAQVDTLFHQLVGVVNAEMVAAGGGTLTTQAPVDEG
jgi:hypothetical protein